MKVTEIILRENHDLKEGEIGLGRKLYRLGRGFTEAETKFINDYTTRYAYEATLHETRYPGVKFDSFADWLKKLRQADPKLDQVEMLNDPTIIQQMNKVAEKKTKEAIDNATKAAKKGEMDTKPLKAFDGSSIIRKIYSLGYPALVMAAIEEPTRQYLTHRASLNYWLSRGVISYNASKQNADPSYKDKPEDLKRWATLSNEQFYHTYITTLTANLMTLLPGLTVTAADKLTAGSILWEWIVKLLPGLGKIVGNKGLKWLTTPGKGALKLLFSTLQITLLWDINEAPGLDSDQKGIANLSDLVWVKVNEYSNNNTEWGWYEGPDLAGQYMWTDTLSIGDRAVNNVSSAIKSGWESSTIQTIIKKIEELPIAEPELGKLDKKVNTPPAPTPGPGQPEGPGKGDGKTIPPGEPGNPPEQPGSPAKPKPGEIGYINDAGWEIVRKSGDRTIWKHPNIPQVAIQEPGEPEPS